jgi:tetratricopeptide (TPR) repeat protein
VRIKPLHIRLAEELSVEVDPERRAELLARCAAHLARIGRFEEAAKMIGDLRKVFADGRSGRATVWMMLSEGLVHLFREESTQALDRISRAQFLGTAMRYPAIVALASAWKAHIEQSRSEFPKMAQSLRIALENATDDDLDSHTRIGLVLFNSFMICGDRTQAQKWFMRTHDRAVRNGDQASIEALMYNRATLGIADLRAEKCLGEVPIGSLSTARSEMASVSNLQPMLLGAIFQNYVELWLARLLLLEGRYLDAIERFKSARTMAPNQEDNVDKKFTDLEIAFCLFNADDRGAALAIFQSVGAGAFSQLHVDDRLVAEWMRWQMMVDPQFGDAQLQAQLLSSIRDEYASLKGQVSQAIAEFHVQ